MSRSLRLHTLREILGRRPAATQDELVESLADAGLTVTQATVSRDLSAIGAVRGADGYQLPDQLGVASAVQDPEAVATAVRTHAISVARADSLVVVRTAPGHANVLAAELDTARPDGMVGCIAGDDTIFIATPSGKRAGELTALFNEMLEG